MRLVRSLKNIKSLIMLFLKIPLGDILFLLQSASSVKPNIGFKKNEYGSICGIENDFLFEMSLTNGVSGNEPHFENIAQIFVDAETNVLDVGANIGTHSIVFSRHAKNGEVFAFEPQSLVYSLLQTNLLLNSCSNVTPYKFAVTEKDNDIISMEAFSFKAEGKDHEINNGARRVDKGKITKGDLVLTRTLDSLDFPKIGFIKFDIQGAEIDALRGAENLIKRDRPVMFIEVEEHHLSAFGGSSKELIEKIFSLGYALFRIETNYPCDHLCIPLEQVSDFEEKYSESISCELTKLNGTEIELFFDSDQRLNYYDSFVITK